MGELGLVITGHRFEPFEDVEAAEKFQKSLIGGTFRNE